MQLKIKTYNERHAGLNNKIAVKFKNHLIIKERPR